MGRNKLVMKKIEDSTSRQRTYSKHKDSLVKKANELAILCDTDVGLLMFSPTGEVTRYSSRGSVEDVMLRIVNNPGELNRGPISNEQHLAQSLTESKHEGQMVEKIAVYATLLLHSLIVIYSSLFVRQNGYVTTLSIFLFSFSAGYFST
ncbi:hypothetical protein P3S68_004410 [Capsicum galapagoense]